MKSDEICRLTNNIIKMLGKKLVSSYIDVFIVMSFKISIQRRQWQPTPLLLPGKFHGQRSLVGCSPWGH